MQYAPCVERSEKANPPRTVGREVYELLEREYGARADEIESGKGTKK